MALPDTTNDQRLEPAERRLGATGGVSELPEIWLQGQFGSFLKGCGKKKTIPHREGEMVMNHLSNAVHRVLLNQGPGVPYFLSISRAALIMSASSTAVSVP